MKFRHFLIVFILVSNTLLVSGQHINIRNLNVESGLSSNYIRTIYKDSFGLIWIGTDTGLDSYDGTQIVNYRKRFKTPLKGAIQSILESNTSSLWICNEQGAFLYQRNGNVTTPINFNETALNVRKVIRSRAKEIYFATEKGLFVLDSLNNSAKPIILDEHNLLQQPSFTDIVEDDRQKLWISSHKGLYCYDPVNKTSTVVHLNGDNNSNTIRAIECVGSDIIALGTDNGAYLFTISTGKYALVKGTEGMLITSLSVNHDELIIGTDSDGILAKSLQSGKITTLFSKPGPVYSVLFDENKMIWWGTLSEGVYYSNSPENQRFMTVDIYEKHKINIRSAHFNSNGDIYVGSRNGFYILDSQFQLKKEFLPFSTPNLRSRIVTTICPHPKNPELFFIGTFGGGGVMFNNRTHTFQNISDNPVFQKGTVYSFMPDKYDNVWIATLDGLFKLNLNSNGLTKFDLTKVLSNNELFSLSIDKQDRLWIGTKTGVCFLSLKNNKFYIPKWSSAYKYQVGYIYQDKMDHLWISYNKGGVLEIDSNLRVSQWISDEMGLPENAPSSIIEDANNVIWVGTQKGLYKVNRNGFVQSHGYDDGLTGLAFCPGLATTDSDGNLWWANEKGFVTLNKKYSSSQEASSSLLFSDLFINGIGYPVDNTDFITAQTLKNYEVTIKGRKKNNLDLRFSALNYHNPTMSKYSFYLEGIDESWSRPSTSNVVSYKNLPARKHVLKVLSANSDGVGSTAPTEITINIIPYFYETWWFVVMVSLLVLLLILYLTRTYVSRVKMELQARFEEIKRMNTKGGVAPQMSEERRMEIKNKLIDYMKQEKPYLNPELREVDVLVALNLNLRDVSKVLNFELNQSFPDFVNSFRIEEVKALIQSREMDNYTLLAIAMQCGFNSKSSFLRAFKKSTNMTPSEFFKEVKFQ